MLALTFAVPALARKHAAETSAPEQDPACLNRVLPKAAMDEAAAKESARLADSRGSENALADATVLLVRHADKPDAGPGLSQAGEARAAAYARYFHPFLAGGGRFEPDTLIATADSPESRRPRLTLEPLSRATGLPIDTRFANGDEKALAKALRTEPHGRHILIAWHHGHLPKLIRALRGDPAAVLPDGRWPDDVYDWVIELAFDSRGELADARRIREELPAASP